MSTLNPPQMSQTSPRKLATMDSLPTELLGLILLCNVRMCECDKNLALPLRLVCKDFDAALRPYIFKTVQLEFSRFLRNVPRPRIERLAPLGHLCEALYLDMMVVRDEEEIYRLTEVFEDLATKVPEMAPLLASLRKYCMNENTFDESDFRGILENVLEHTPNVTRLKFNLPFQVVGQLSTTATILLATTFDCLANRPEDSKILDTLVLDHVSDTTINAICHNHMDLTNAIKVFAGLKTLVLSLKRQDSMIGRQVSFAQNMWFLIRKAVNMESLCLTGWNVKRDSSSRRLLNSVTFQYWMMRSLPYTVEGASNLKSLRYLELKQVNIEPQPLVQLIKETSSTLREVYLIEVYLKVYGTSDLGNIPLWIGHPDIPRPAKALWVADELRNFDGLKLNVLRATCLGYDDFEPDLTSAYPDYDLKDPTGRDRSFDERFIQAVNGHSTPSNIKATCPGSDDIKPDLKPAHSDYDIKNLTSQNRSSNSRFIRPVNIHPTPSTTSQSPKTEDIPLEPQAIPKTHPNLYDAEAFQRTHNTTSYYKRCIDGYFLNHNEQALKELQNIITVADRGMTRLSEGIERDRQRRVDELTGALT